MLRVKIKNMPNVFMLHVIVLSVVAPLFFNEAGQSHDHKTLSCVSIIILDQKPRLLSTSSSLMFASRPNSKWSSIWCGDIWTNTFVPRTNVASFHCHCTFHLVFDPNLRLLELILIRKTSFRI
jgi:hypothetical protein